MKEKKSANNFNFKTRRFKKGLDKDFKSIFVS
jgi:hypothetical protein